MDQNGWETVKRPRRLAQFMPEIFAIDLGSNSLGEKPHSGAESPEKNLSGAKFVKTTPSTTKSSTTRPLDQSISGLRDHCMEACCGVTGSVTPRDKSFKAMFVKSCAGDRETIRISPYMIFKGQFRECGTRGPRDQSQEYWINRACRAGIKRRSERDLDNAGLAENSCSD